jgi:hypothetical protein
MSTRCSATPRTTSGQPVWLLIYEQDRISPMEFMTGRTSAWISWKKSYILTVYNAVVMMTTGMTMEATGPEEAGSQGLPMPVDKDGARSALDIRISRRKLAETGTEISVIQMTVHDHMFAPTARGTTKNTSVLEVALRRDRVASPTRDLPTAHLTQPGPEDPLQAQPLPQAHQTGILEILQTIIILLINFRLPFSHAGKGRCLAASFARVRSG